MTAERCFSVVIVVKMHQIFWGKVRHNLGIKIPVLKSAATSSTTFDTMLFYMYYTK